VVSWRQGTEDGKWNESDQIFVQETVDSHRHTDVVEQDDLEVLDHGVRNSKLGDLEGCGQSGLSFAKQIRDALNIRNAACERCCDGGFSDTQGDASIGLFERRAVVGAVTTHTDLLIQIRRLEACNQHGFVVGLHSGKHIGARKY
jgi:hypothetical protein